MDNQDQTLSPEDRLAEGKELGEGSKRARPRSLDRPRSLELLVTGLVLGAAVSVPLTVLGLPWIHDHLSTLAAVMLAVLVLGVLATIPLFSFRHRLLETIGLRADVQLGEAMSQLSRLARLLAAGTASPADAGRTTEEAARTLVSWYVWARAWRRVVLLVLALLGGFGALVGASLLAEQNRFFREQTRVIQDQIEQQRGQNERQLAEQQQQNRLLRDQLEQQRVQDEKQLTEQQQQNELLQNQIDQQASDNEIVRRAQLLATIYEEECEQGTTGDQIICRPKAPVPARQEAALAFLRIERGRGVQPDLRRADLTDADLTRANLRGVNLFGAKLSGAILSGADLRDARNLTEEQIYAARGDAETRLPEGLRQPLFWKLLTGTDTWNRWRQEKPETFAPDLRRAHLNWAELGEADLQRADLVSAKLYKAGLVKANLREAELGGANLGEADLREADLEEADLRDASLSRANLAGANLSGAFLVGAILSEANLSGAILSAAVLAETDLSGAFLHHADLGYAYLDGAILSKADLSGADLLSADLSGADLSGTDLSGTDLRNANLGGVNLETVRNLTQEQIESARGDAETELPRGLEHPEHWISKTGGPSVADPGEPAAEQRDPDDNPPNTHRPTGGGHATH